jgi:hypothetical protein
MNHSVKIRTMKSSKAGLNHHELLNPGLDYMKIQNDFSPLDKPKVMSPKVILKDKGKSNIRALIKGSYTRN